MLVECQQDDIAGVEGVLDATPHHIDGVGARVGKDDVIALCSD